MNFFKISISFQRVFHETQTELEAYFLQKSSVLPGILPLKFLTPSMTDIEYLGNRIVTFLKLPSTYKHSKNVLTSGLTAEMGTT